MGAVYYGFLLVVAAALLFGLDRWFIKEPRTIRRRVLDVALAIGCFAVVIGAFVLFLVLIGLPRAKRKRLTTESYRDYEACLDKLARYFADLEIGALEPPAGTERLEEFLDAQWGNRAGRTYNKNLSILRDFFKFQGVARKASRRSDAPYRTRQETRSPQDHIHERRPGRVLANSPELRDRIALRAPASTRLRDQEGNAPTGSVPPLRPPATPPNDIHEGRQDS